MSILDIQNKLIDRRAKENKALTETIKEIEVFISRAVPKDGKAVVKYTSIYSFDPCLGLSGFVVTLKDGANQYTLDLGELDSETILHCVDQAFETMRRV